MDSSPSALSSLSSQVGVCDTYHNQSINNSNHILLNKIVQMKFLSALLLLALSPTRTVAFAPANNHAVVSDSTASTTSLQMGPPAPKSLLAETYGEGSRKYRRTVYTHNEWVKHRSSDRFIRNISSMPISRIS